ncbi:hypothetical protein HNQ71_006444 [Mesorhizobium sangaii]|uniref:Uncharacterized protein n=1 Tax=Mesorhizobium sangaii TaxID=505389 RepID=A0A841PYB5_9HYPH|nr:hypothetical protein [Mesorhizobium sangaii]
MSIGNKAIPASSRTMRMLQANEAAARLQLHELGRGAKRLAKAFGCTQHDSAAVLARGRVCCPCGRTVFDRLDDWLGERFISQGRQRDVKSQGPSFRAKGPRYTAPPFADLDNHPLGLLDRKTVCPPLLVRRRAQRWASDPVFRSRICQSRLICRLSAWHGPGRQRGAGLQIRMRSPPRASASTWRVHADLHRLGRLALACGLSSGARRTQPPIAAFRLEKTGHVAQRHHASKLNGSWQRLSRSY